MRLIDAVFQSGDTADMVADKLEKSGMLKLYINHVLDKLEQEEFLEFSGRWADDGGNLDIDAEP